MNSATLHVKVSPAVADGLKRIAETREQSVGELVRQAIARCYQPDTSTLTQPQQLALDAYRGGHVSIGKLAETMGLHVLDMRQWLNEHGIPQNAALSEDDVRNA